MLFVGSGVYFDKPHKKVSALIKGLDASIVNNAVSFGTYGNQNNIDEQISKLLREQGINIIGELFVCKGASIGTDNKGHPDIEDLGNAKKFAENIVKSYNN